MGKKHKHLASLDESLDSDRVEHGKLWTDLNFFPDLLKKKRVF